MENNWKETLEDEFDKRYVTIQNGQQVIGYNNNLAPSPYDVKVWMFEKITSLLQEQRQRMAKRIEGERLPLVEEGLTWGDTKADSNTVRFGYNEGLQAALNIVLGEGEKQ